MATALDSPPPPSPPHTPREWLLLLGESYNTTLQDPGSFPINSLIRPTHWILFPISAIYFHGINRSHLPQIISKAQRVTWKKQLNAPWLTCLSSLPTNTFACSFMTSKKSSRIVKWNVGVNIFLLERHLFPVLKGHHNKLKRSRAATQAATASPAPLARFGNSLNHGAAMISLKWEKVPHSIIYETENVETILSISKMNFWRSVPLLSLDLQTPIWP